MPSPFYDAIKGTTAGTPGTGAFTPNAASTGFIAWSTVPTGWIGKVRFADGTAWSLEYCYWNGTTLSRASTQVAQGGNVLQTSTGAHLTLTSAATGAMIVDSLDVGQNLSAGNNRGLMGIPGATGAPIQIGMPAATVTGTAISAAVATTNYLTEQPRSEEDSATTANAQAGLSAGLSAIYSTTAGRGGFVFESSFGASQLPTGPRLFVGMASATFIGQTIEPSAYVAHIACFAKDSTDTNIQLLVNSNASTGTKTDTGIALVANGWYTATVWADPGGGRIYGKLVRHDTGAIWIGSTTTDIPTTTTLRMQTCGGLSATTGTGFFMHVSTMFCRAGR